MGGLIGIGAVSMGFGAYYGIAAVFANPFTINQAAITAAEFGAGDALGAASLSAGATTLYRVVDDVELEAIMSHLKFGPSPNGDSVKRFLDNLPDAKALRDVFENFWKRPQHVVEARASNSAMNAANVSEFHDVGRAQKSVNIPNEKLDEVEVAGVLCTGTRINVSGC